jgi:hypothetical protein
MNRHYLTSTLFAAFLAIVITETGAAQQKKNEVERFQQ